MEIEKKPSTNEETYRIYNYFKKYPGILLSAVSVLTAVLAVVAMLWHFCTNISNSKNGTSIY